MIPRLPLLVLILAALLATGCSKKQKAPPAPPPPAQQPAPPDLIDPPTQTKPRPTVPEEPIPEVQEPQAAPPPKGPERPTRPSRRRPVQTAPKPEQSEPEPQENIQKAPQLAVALSEKERAFYENSFSTMAAETRKAIEEASTRDLAPAQKDDLGRIRGLLAQAEQSRESDIRTSARLAQRAALLSRELLKTIR